MGRFRGDKYRGNNSICIRAIRLRRFSGVKIPEIATAERRFEIRSFGVHDFGQSSLGNWFSTPRSPILCQHNLRTRTANRYQFKRDYSETTHKQIRFIAFLCELHFLPLHEILKQINNVALFQILLLIYTLIEQRVILFYGRNRNNMFANYFPHKRE